MPVKSRETEGGGHAHLFSRDILQAMRDIKEALGNCHILVTIVAENWSPSELFTIQEAIDQIFHFDMSPNIFHGFDEASQITLNKYVERILNKTT